MSILSLHVWVYCNSSPCSCQRSDDVDCSWQNHNFSLTAYMIPTFRLSAGAQLARLLANYQHSVCDVPFVKHSGSCLPSAECPQFFPHYAPTPSEMQVQKVRSHKFQSMRSLAREYTVIKLRRALKLMLGWANCAFKIAIRNILARFLQRGATFQPQSCLFHRGYPTIVTVKAQGNRSSGAVRTCAAGLLRTLIATCLLTPEPCINLTSL